MPRREGVCLVFCRGVYSCHWSPSRQNRPRCACCWFSVVTIVSLLTLGWMYICLAAFNDREDFNGEAFKTIKKLVNWFLVVVVLSAVLAVYSCLLLVFALFHAALREPLDLHWIHKVFLLLSVFIISAGISGMCLKWNTEWDTVYLFLQATAPFLQLSGVGALTLLSWFVFQRFFRAKTGFKFLVLAMFLVVSATVFLSPLFMKSACLLEELPPKPQLIGHRGAPMLAPENTMMSFEKSVACGVMAFETDVQISTDKVPFLMHDDTLRRSTNVIAEQAENRSSSFSWVELEKLNAGKWFLENDPFHTVSSLSEKDREAAQNQTIPRLLDLLVLAKKKNISLIFDMKSDSSDYNLTHHVVDVILKSGIPQAQVMWLPPTHRAHVRTQAPGFRHIYANASEMNKDGESLLNWKYTKLSTDQFWEQRRANMSVNLFVVNEPWLFSVAWCSGASSVTTNACHHFKDMTKPVWYMTPHQYIILWITVDSVSLLVMLLVFLFQCRRNGARGGTFPLDSDRGTPLLSLSTPPPPPRKEGKT